MKDLTEVKKFYESLATLGKFDFAALAARREDDNPFATPPVFQKEVLPFWGGVEIGLAVLGRIYSQFADERSCQIVLKDNPVKYADKSEVVFLVKDHPVLGQGEWGGYKIIRTYHSRLFGYPLTAYTKGKWQIRPVCQFWQNVLPECIRKSIHLFYPLALHEWPFEDGETIELETKDVNKIRGYRWTITTKEAALSIIQDLEDRLYREEKGNVHCYTEVVGLQGVIWVKPPFGRSYVALKETP